MTDIAKRIAALPPEKRALLLKKLKEQGALENLNLNLDDGQEKVEIPSVDRTRKDGFPLSSSQERLWFLSQFAPEDPSFNLFYLLRLEGNFQKDKLEEAISLLVQRHETLRTVFRGSNGQPRQFIQETSKLEVVFTSLRHLDQASQKEAIAEATRAHHLAPFDLTQGPLLRFGYVATGEQDGLLMVTVHHIVSDGWSLDLLTTELATLYAAQLQGVAASLAPLSVQYVDYAVWQREHLRETNDNLDWWRRYLSGAPTVLEMPLDRPRPARRSYRGSSEIIKIEGDSGRKLRELAKEQGATPFMGLLAVYSFLLHRYCRQEEVLVGSPVANRSKRELEGLIGFFVNMVVLRADLSSTPSFKQLLTRLRGACLSAFKHQELSFDRLVEELQPERNLSVSPLFQAALVLQNTRHRTMSIPGLRLTPVEPERETSQFDLLLELREEDDGGFSGLLEYSSVLFEASTIRRFIEHFKQALSVLCNLPETPINKLSMLSPEERNRLLAEINQVHDVKPTPLMIDQMMRFAQEHGDRDALVFEDDNGRTVLSYQALNNAANHVANDLIQRGVQAGNMVGLLMERTPEMLVGLLGILKAGAAYVPLDPSYPEERNQFIYGDCHLAGIVTTQALDSPFAGQSGFQVLVDRTFPGESVGPNTALTANLPAYVIYTSGSTGKPKGVVVNHGNMSRLFHATQAQFSFDSDDVSTCFHSFAFDFSVWEIWSALAYGGKLVLVPYLTSRSTSAFYQLLVREKVTHLSQTPSAFNQLIQEDLQQKEDLALRLVVFGGEALAPQTLEPWVARHGDQKPALINMYGITETTVHVTYRQILSDDISGVSTIGRPIKDLALYVLQENLEPAPCGVPGEIYVGGAGLAHGYHQRPGLTALRFLPNPFGEMGQRLYRTGDLGQMQEDGDVIYRGRVDHQVKVRGFRIELGEIEAALAAHDSVSDAVVLVRNDRLVAYPVVSSLEGDEQIRELHRFLSNSLPEHMVPTAIMPLTELPLTTSNKTDRNALPDPMGTGIKAAYEAPRNARERALVGMWQELLEMERIGIHDNFFELGGHSLLATRLISQIRRSFDIEVPLASLFSSPTPAGLAEELSLVDQDGLTKIPTIQPASDEAKKQAPLSFTQKRLWFLEQLEGSNAVYNIPITLRIKGRLDKHILLEAFKRIEARHSVLRSRIGTENGEPRQVFHDPGNVVFHEYAPTGDHTEELVFTYLKTEARSNFNLAEQSPWRLTLAQLSEDDHILLIVLHHIAADGWSVGILVSEMVTIYEALSKDQFATLPPLPLQYLDYAVWQDTYLNEAYLSQQIDYWRQTLDGIPPLLELPTDRPRLAQQDYRGQAIDVSIESALTRDIKAFGEASNTTLFNVLLSAFQVLLHRYSGQNTVCVGSPFANRGRAELETMIGFFVNTLTMRADFEDSPNFETLLQRMHQNTLGAFNHSDVPFERVVDALKPARQLNASPLFQVSFALQNAPMDTASPSGLDIKPLDLEHTTAKFDISVSLWERDDCLKGYFEFKSALFDQSTIERMSSCFAEILCQCIQQPKTPVACLQMLPAQQIEEMPLRGTETPISSELAHNRIVQLALNHPEMIALRDDRDDTPITHTFSELISAANGVAFALREKGVKVGDRVGVSMQPGFSMLSSLVGALMSGATYVPIDPQYPLERRQYIAEDAHLSLLLTDEPAASLNSLACLDISTVAKRGAAPHMAISPNCPAYMIYTSGSTGHPKGVVVSHRSLNNYLHWCETHLIGNIQLPLVSSLSFDASLKQIFGMLLQGKFVWLLPPANQVSPEVLLQKIGAQSSVGLNCAPPLWRVLVEAMESGSNRPVSLKRLFLGSEAFDRTLVERSMVVLPNLEVFNLYGPTEATANAAWSQLYADKQVVLGKPLQNTCSYILNKRLQVQPVGVPGTLFLSGEGLAQGYFNRASLTAERFLPNPFEDQGSRMYDTGDVCLLQEDGDIRFVGRQDDQLKIRGFRIEAGEVSYQLKKFSEVKDAEVFARKDESGVVRLVAALCLGEGASSEFVSNLRHDLGKQLPDYMVPALYETYDHFPTTPTGKTDRKALMNYVNEPREVEVADEPRNEVERKLASIWGSLLGRSHIGIHDNFFELGGDSILSIQIVSRAGQEGIHLTPRQVFQHQTIAALASVSETTQRITAEQGSVSGEARLTPIQRSFLERNAEAPNHYNQSVVLELPSELAIAQIEQALSIVLNHHDVFSLSFQNRGVWQQIHGDGARFTFDVHTLKASDDPLKQKMADEAQASLDIFDGPLCKALLFNENGQKSLFLTIHHLIVDGVSWRILLEDLNHVCRALLVGGVPSLPPKTSSFKEWTNHLYTFADSETVREQVSRWEHSDSLRPQVENSFVGDIVECSQELDKTLSLKILNEACRAYRMRPHELMIAALGLALSSVKNSDQVVLDIESHGRETFGEKVDLTRTVGWFTCAWPLVIPCNTAMDAILKKVKEDLRTVPENGIAYGLLRGHRTGEIVFNYLGKAGQNLENDWVLKPSEQSLGADRGAKSQRPYVFEMSAITLDNRLLLKLFHPKSQEDLSHRLMEQFCKSLKDVADYCVSVGYGGATPSDFPLTALDQDQLDQLLVDHREVVDLFPLSPMQQGLLFHAQLSDNTSQYLEQLSCRLVGDLNVADFREAWRRIIDRYGVLRTSFHWSNLDSPLQALHDQPMTNWRELDWRNEANHQERLDSFLAEERSAGFVFEHAPLSRWTLIQLTDNSWQFVWTHHHLLLDGWSLGKILRDAFLIYESLVLGETATLPDCRPFKDFVAWTLEQDEQEARSFWKNYLSGFEVASPLPGASRSNQSEQEHHVLEENIDLSISQGLRGLSRRRRLTLNSIVQGAWALLVSRYSGERDVVFGATVSGRPASLKGIEDMVGLFINTLPARCILNNEQPAHEWMAQIQSDMLELERFNWCQLANVQSWSDLPSGLPLFDHILVFENYPVDEAVRNQISGLEMEGLQTFEQTHYPLMISILPGDEIGIRFTYEPSVYRKDAISLLSSHFQKILHGFSKNDELKLESYSLLDASARATLLSVCQTEKPFPQVDLGTLFRKQVNARPKALAYCNAQGEALHTYEELLLRAEALGYELSRIGVSRGDRVGIHLRRSAELPVALLSCLLIGACYVPLEPDYPEDRRAYMMHDAEVTVVLTRKDDDLVPETNVPLIYADQQLEHHPLPECQLFGNDLAYIIYTSGSTGKPKGVFAHHRGAVNRANWMWEAFPFGENEVCCVKTSLNFVDSIWEIFGPLLTGVPSVLIPDEIVGDVDKLCQVLRTNRATRFLLVPSLLRALINAFPDLGTRLPDLAFWSTSGEALPADLLNAFHEILPGRKLLNLYGSSEAAGDSTAGLCEAGSGDASIGKPIANTSTYILDKSGHLVAPGIAGELHIGGAGVARGYVGRPGLTARQFIPDRFGNKAGARLYRTGDLVRFRPDGNLEFVGRVDRQIKLRGFRVELGEIEAIISQYDSVDNCAVLVSEAQNDARLVGFFTQINTSIEPEEVTKDLRSYLSASLPDYMVPSHLIALEQIPLTPNGKIDRVALMRMLPKVIENTSASFEPPATKVEKQLAEIWQDVLHVSQVGRHDHFFELGGHSLLATQVVSRIRKTLQIDIPLKTLFSAPTLSELSDAVNQLMSSHPELVAPKIVVAPRDGNLPLSFAQQRLWFIDQLEGGGATYNMPAALSLMGNLCMVTLNRSINAIIARHEALRTSFPSHDGKPYQLISPYHAFSLSIIDLQGLGGENAQAKASQIIDLEHQHIFDLGKGPLYRLNLLQTDSDTYTLLVTMHHIISDGWSVGVLIRELVTHYNELLYNPQAKPLPELVVQYPDFSYWQRRYLSGDVLERQLNYWVEHLQDAPSLLELPTDYNRPAMQTFNGCLEHFRIDASQTNKIHELSRKTDTTLFMCLMSAYLVMLYKYSSQNDIIVGVSVANRNQQELEPLIGFFVNSLATRTDVSGNPSFHHLLERFRSVALNAFENQDIPFEQIVDTVQPDRSLDHSPIFQVDFVLQNAPSSSLSLPGVTLKPVGLDLVTAKFDLTLGVMESDDVLECSFEYNSDLFMPQTIKRMAEHYASILRSITENPGVLIDDIEIVGDMERQHLLDSFNDTSEPYRKDTCFQHCFEEVAAQKPSTVAIQDHKGNTWTYQELDQYANRLAHRLVQLGVKPETVVATYISRSFKLVGSMLATMKAGAAYVPLDASYPKPRLSYILDDSAPMVVLTDQKDELPESNAVILDLDEPFADDLPDTPVKVSVTSLNMAYIIYTSGSTGHPKGVLLNHQGLMNYLDWAKETYLSQEVSKVPLHSPVGFDATITSLWLPLLSGLTIDILDEASEIDALRDAVFSDRGYDFVKLTPAHLEMLNPQLSLHADKLSSKRFVLGGEALPLSSLLPWMEHAPHTVFINEYGPTEAVVGCCVYEYAGQELPPGSVPIGEPINNVQLYVLDRHLRLSGQGIHGQLFIGGDGLARGYLGKPGLTADRFLPDPFSSEPGSRIYKTGDLVKFLNNGQLQFIGRADHQVKLRGYRIEPGEIEVLLEQHPAVRDKIVITREISPGDIRLVAYVVGDPAWKSADKENQDHDQDQVSQWEAVFQDSYSKPIEDGLGTVNFAGWNDSYSGEPIPYEEMFEWMTQTVERIRQYRPKRVLELGCGTGLLLFRIVPDCDHYTGFDFSSEALRFVHQQLEANDISHVDLHVRGADNHEGIQPRSYDTVIINSVMQYFPGVNYLLDVIGKSVEALADGGRLFIGDVRSLPLLEAFHASVAFYQASDDMAVDQLKQNIREGFANDPELVMDPLFFHHIKTLYPRIGKVSVELKKDRFSNELSCFRYDVTLHIDGNSYEEKGWVKHQWNGESPEDIAAKLRKEGLALYALEDVPCALLDDTNQLRNALNQSFETVRDIKTWLNQNPLDQSVPNDRWWALEEELDYDVSLDWTRSNISGNMTVYFRHRNRQVVDQTKTVSNPTVTRPWHSYANNPLHARMASELAPKLREQLTAQLPEYMVPSAIIVLEKMPLTTNGKVDRKALPLPEDAFRKTQQEYVAPKTPTEQILAAIWCEVLSIETIGIHSNFFDLGGHSLLATQVISRTNNAFDKELPIRTIFDTPTIHEMGALIDAHVEDGSAKIPPIVPVNRSGELPLSFTQQRLWFINELEGPNASYNMSSTLTLVGSLQASLLADAFLAVAKRHEAMRTYFPSSSGKPYLAIYDEPNVVLKTHDIRSSSPDLQGEQLNKLLDDSAQEPFNLETGPLYRVTLVHVGPDKHVLNLTMHHIISDGWSLGLVIREVTHIYNSLKENKAPSLEPLSLQFTDYASWQHQQLKGDFLDMQVSWWKRQLEQAPTLLELPTDYPRPHEATFQGSSIRFTLDESTSREIKLLSRRKQVTPFITLMSVYGSLLGRLCQTDDILIGTAIANRHRDQVENIIGCFANTLVLRTDMRGNISFNDLLLRVREITVGGYNHQDVPFESLVEAMITDRKPGISPLFQVMFILQNTPETSAHLDGVAVEPFERDGGTARFDLSLNMYEADGVFHGVFDYRADLFSVDTMTRMGHRFATVASELVHNPEVTMQGFSLVTDEEKANLLGSLSGSNETKAYVHFLDVLAKWVYTQPNHIALVEANAEVPYEYTYSELDSYSNLIASHLKDMGVTHESVVAIALERSVNCVLAQIAILKAGGCFLALDVSHPAERRRETIDDARCACLITEDHLVENTHVPTILMNQTGINLNGKHHGFDTAYDFETVKVDALSGAYVIYTSGSTGKPKGTRLPHLALSNMAREIQGFFEVDTSSRLLRVVSPAFDVSVLETFITLFGGGTLVSCSQVQSMPGEPLLNTLNEHQISHMVYTPSGIMATDPSRLTTLKYVCVGGEVLPPELVSTWSPYVNFVNGYGPTEAAVFNAGAYLDGSGRISPLGSIGGNMRSYVLDRNMKLVPPGVPGQLYLGGDCLGRCYTSRPKLTAKSFVPNPFTDSSGMGSRLYATGDLVRMVPNEGWGVSRSLGHQNHTVMLFCGRIDHQIKLRGYRIELGEIENRMLTHPKVADVAVILRDDPGGSRLAAYLVAESEDEGALFLELKEMLRKELPDYMVPNAFMLLDQMPLARTGKLDRKYLASKAMVPVTAGAEVEFVAPRNKVEEEVSSIWAELLALDEVSVTANFFDLGGHSLLATQVISRVQETYGVKLPLARLFEEPSVAGLAETIWQLADIDDGFDDDDDREDGEI